MSATIDLDEVRAIPTRYAGVQFRSRLEARWAAFFDLLGWPWEYEPIDLAGYIPDFALRTGDGSFLVEVKPIIWASFSSREAIGAASTSWRTAAIPIAEKAVNAGADAVVVLGTAPITDSIIGLQFVDRVKMLLTFTRCRCGQPCAFGTKCCSANKVDWAASRAHDNVDVFRKAGNRVQWRAP